MSKDIIKALERILILIENNLHTSASNIGLKNRGNNLREIQKELLFILNLTDEESEEIYWNWIKQREE